MNYAREIEILKGQFPPTVFRLVSSSKAFVAGGAIASVFSSSRINDFDLFFKTKTDLDYTLLTISRDEKTIETDSALSVIDEGHRVQLIKVITGTPEEVIKSFDFTICQAAYDFESGFIFGPEFFLHLAQRRLVFNISAEYPICSLYRLQKFIKRGFQFSGIDAIKLGLRIQALRLATVEDLRRQLMGIDTLFLKDLTDSLVGEAEKRYDFNEFMATLEIWLDRLNALTGVPDA